VTQRREPTSLDEATDHLNVKLVDAEALFFRQGFSTHTSVSLPDGSFSPPVGRLGWGKHNGAFRLLFYNPYYPDEPILLSSTSRRIRVMAAHHLDELYEALVEASAGTLEELDRACDTIDNFLGKRGGQ
jgi:hypothetical protein